MSIIQRLAGEVAALIVREGLDYHQTKALFKTARLQAGLKPPPKKRGGVERLTLAEELRFIDQAYAQDGRTGLMMQVLLETGARVSEFIQLRVEDISFEERVVIIRHGKGDKRREVPIRRELAQLLQIHLDQRRAGPLFRSRQQGSGSTPYLYTRQRIGQRVRQIAQAAGIHKRVYPHLLRHTMATRLLSLGMDIAEVQRFLGHEDIATTQLYAITSIAALRKKFDQVTDPNGQSVIADIQHRHGDRLAAFASDLLAARVA